MTENNTTPSDEKSLHMLYVHEKFVTQSKQGFEPGENLSPDDESGRYAPLRLAGDHVVGRDKEMEVDDGNPFKESIQKAEGIARVRLKKTPKTSAERAREFRARKARLKQQKPPNSIVKSTTDDIQNYGSDYQGRIETRGVSETTKRQAKTAAQRMREYRKRKKLANKMPLKQQDDQNSDAITHISLSEVNQAAQPTINSVPSKTECADSHSQHQLEGSESAVKRPFITVIFRKKDDFSPLGCG